MFQNRIYSLKSTVRIVDSEKFYKNSCLIFSMKKGSFQKIITSFFSLVAYFALSAVVLLYANGLKFDGCSLDSLEFCSIQETSGLYLDGQVSDLEATSFRLNSLSLEVSSLPQKLLWLKAGSYTLDVEREGFVPLHKNFELVDGKVQRIYILMIPQDLVFETGTILPSEKNEILEVRRNHEIWDTSGVHDVFLGRMSESILQVVTLVDGYMAILNDRGTVTVVDWDVQNRVQFPWKNVVGIRAGTGELSAELADGKVMIWNVQ